MKYEISDGKLEQVIFKYLDNKNFIIKEIPNNYLFLESEDDEFAQIRVVKSNKFCYIFVHLIPDIKTFFSIDNMTTIRILTKYVEKTLGINISESHLGGSTNNIDYILNSLL